MGVEKWCDKIFEILDQRVGGIVTQRLTDDTLFISIKYKTIDIGFEISSVERLVEAGCPPQLAAKKVIKTYEKIIRRLFVR